MNRLLLATVALSSAVIAAAPAEARQGCGIGFHRGYYGRCIPNRGAIVGRPGPVIGVFYPGRGYWYGGRYWGHRYRWHGGWRYR
jgi:hypothetical protein